MDRVMARLTPAAPGFAGTRVATPESVGAKVSQDRRQVMRWLVFGTVFALALSPAGAPWAQQQGATPSTSSDSSTAQPATPTTPDSSTPQSTPTPAPAPPQSVTPQTMPSM